MRQHRLGTDTVSPVGRVGNRFFRIVVLSYVQILRRTMRRCMDAENLSPFPVHLFNFFNWFGGQFAPGGTEAAFDCVAGGNDV